MSIRLTHLSQKSSVGVQSTQVMPVGVVCMCLALFLLSGLKLGKALEWCLSLARYRREVILRVYLFALAGLALNFEKCLCVPVTRAITDLCTSCVVVVVSR